MRLLRPFLRAYQKSGLQSLVRGSGLLKLLPKQLSRDGSADAEARVPARPHRGRNPRAGQKRKRVGLLLGCVQREFMPEINAATVRVLAAEGCEVVAPPDQPCCGALMVHAGEEAPALELARRMIDVFEQANVDVIITNAGGCGSNVREYGYQLRDDPQYAERAARFSAKCKDITEFLEELGPRAATNRCQPARRLSRLVPSCSMRSESEPSQGRSSPRSPAFELLDLPEAALCCGSAGIYNLVQPKTADASSRSQGAAHHRRQSPTSSPPVTSDACCKSPPRSNAKDRRRRCCTPSS